MAGEDASPFRVRTVYVTGAEYTSQSLFDIALEPLYRARTLGAVVAETQKLVNRLRRLGIFEDVGVVLDSSKGGVVPLEREEELVDVALVVKERKRLWAKTGTEVGTSGGNLNTSVNFRNAFGMAETIEASASYGVEAEAALNRDTDLPFGSTASSSFSFVFGKPWNVDPDRRLEIGASRVDRNHMIHSSHMELVNGAFARYRWPLSGSVAEVAGNVAWRNVHKLAQDASLSIRNEVGHTLKSSLQASLSADRRDDSLLPTKGHYYRLACEAAGLADERVRFLRWEGEGSWAKYLGYGFSIAAGMRAGLLQSFAQRSRVNDRFFLGGPQTVRGFRYHGLGPKDGGRNLVAKSSSASIDRSLVDSLGGDAYWAAGISLFTPLPYLVDKPLKGHIFVNAGGLGAMQNGLHNTIRDVATQPSSSAGAGFVLRFSILRLEINFCVPLTVRQGDEYRKGWNLGLGITFL
ncbi:surface antigen-domain-containing protein [Hyaloraphidium curvatum]|nr:surface antigen-domain-containing protein [Hyaloraphidium curvatum]